MKKSILFLACCIGLMLFASCKKDPVAPTITITQGQGYATEDMQIYSGDEITVGFTAIGEKLTKIEITLTENGNVINTSQAAIENLASFSHSATFTINATGTVTVTGIVTDANGLTASKSFNIICNEKPNAKFLGKYEGNALFSGTMEASISGMEPMQQEVTDEEMPIILTISEGETMYEIVATCNINGQESTATGTVDGDKITIVLADVPYTFNYEMSGFTVSPTMVMNLDLVATLVDGQLNLDGTCNGNGVVNLFIYNGTIAIDGTIGGSLEKTE